MRIIGYLEHPGMVVTVFKNDNKISVKFEKNLLELVFKVREDLHLSNVAEVNKLFDAEFMVKIEAIFQEMAAARDNALLRYQSNVSTGSEPDIF